MYAPAEDSLMLEKHSERFSCGRVLDIGTGTGIQALAASKSKSTKRIIAVDVDKEAINYCKRNISHKKIDFQVSDLFSKVDGKFDTILFNPPYLPDEKEIKIKDAALYGGEKGYELIKRFFSEAKNYLSEDGKILFVFSSFTKKKKVDEIIKANGFKFKQLEKQHIFFEDLFVYLVELA